MRSTRKKTYTERNTIIDTKMPDAPTLLTLSNYGKTRLSETKLLHQVTVTQPVKHQILKGEILNSIAINVLFYCIIPVIYTNVKHSI